MKPLIYVLIKSFYGHIKAAQYLGLMQCGCFCISPDEVPTYLPSVPLSIAANAGVFFGCVNNSQYVMPGRRTIISTQHTDSTPTAVVGPVPAKHLVSVVGL